MWSLNDLACSQDQAPDMKVAGHKHGQGFLPASPAVDQAEWLAGANPPQQAHWSGGFPWDDAPFDATFRNPEGWHRLRRHSRDQVSQENSKQPPPFSGFGVSVANLEACVVPGLISILTSFSPSGMGSYSLELSRSQQRWPRTLRWLASTEIRAVHREGQNKDIMTSSSSVTTKWSDQSAWLSFSTLAKAGFQE